MTKKPTEIIHLNLRIREDLRRRLERAAKKRQVSLNYETMSRLEQSFDQEATWTIASVANDIETNWLQFAEAIHGLNMQGDLVRAAEALITALDGLPADLPKREAIDAAVAKVKQATKVIDLNASLAIRRLHSTGETP